MNEQLRTIPIIVGGSGRRHIRPEDAARVKEAAKRELTGLRERYPASPVRLLVSLAEGGDTLLVRAARECGIPYTVVLPFDAEEFARDFAGDALREYRENLAAADEVIVCPDLEGDGKRHSLSIRGAGRDYYYRQATLYVVRTCHLLIAVWDGVPGAKGGCGTGEAVDEALRLADCAVIPIAVSDAGGKPSDAEDRFAASRAACEEILKKTDGFNRAATSLTGALYGLEPDGNGAEKQPDGIPARLSGVYAAADALSVANARKYRGTLFAMAVFATVVTVAFLLYDEMNLHWMILLMAVILLLLFAMNRITKKRASHEKYLEYRVLAERLRVQYFLRKAGLARSVNGCIPWAQEGEYRWIEKALDALLAGPGPAAEGVSVRKEWLGSQRDYHEQAGRKTAKQMRRDDAAQRTALVLTILSFAAALVFEIVWGGLFSGVQRLETADLERVRTVVKIVVGGLSAATLFASNYYGKLSLPRLTADHVRMERFYREAFDAAERDGESEQLLIRLAREELIENGNWVSYEQDNAPDVSIS